MRVLAGWRGDPCRLDTDAGSGIEGEGRTTPLRPGGPTPCSPASCNRAPAQARAAMGTGDVKDLAQRKEDSQRLVLDNPLAL